MIKFALDASGRYELPELVLCNPNRQQLHSIAHHKGLRYRPKLHGLSEISFEVYSHYKDKATGQNTKNPYYGYIVKNRLICMSAGFEDASPQTEWYVIHSAGERFLNGRMSVKTVECYSYERDLGKKNADFLDGTYQFYSYTNPAGTMLQKIIETSPKWRVGQVDTSLITRWRTFSDIKATLYDFMLGECEEAYNCLFVFDTDKLLIHAYDQATFVTQTGIVLSHSNLVKALQIDDGADEIITALSVVGGGGVDIRSVNPVGDNYIYDYSYFKTTEWISEPLIAALTQWENRIAANRQGYAGYLAALKVQTAELLALKTQLTDLEHALEAIDLTRAQQIATATGVQYATTNAYNAKLAEVEGKKNQISAKEAQIAATNVSLGAIVDACKKTNNFTPEQLVELDEITYQGEYLNESYVVTDAMPDAEKQAVYEQLYQRGEREIALRAQPQYAFEMDSMNFLFMERFKAFGAELRLGSIVNVEVREDTWVYPILLELEIDYSNPTSFNMVFGSKLNTRFDLTDIQEALRDSVNTNTKVSSNAATWDLPVKSGFYDEVTGYIKNTLNLANQSIINSDSQTVEIGPFGLRIKKQLANGTYDPHQLWMNNGVIALTDNNWQSSKLAIGIINGVSSVNADVVAGTLLAGNLLTISNEAGSFRVDGSKVAVTNMDMVLANGQNQISLNPATGLKLMNGPYTVVDLDIASGSASFNGSGSFAGNIYASGGTVGSLQIGPSYIKNVADTFQVNADGTGRWGLLTVAANYAEFNGNIYARNLDYKGITNDKIGDSSVGTSNYQNGSVIPSKLDRVYAEYGEFDTLRSNVGEIENLVAKKAYITQLEAVEASVENLVTGSTEAAFIWARSILVTGIQAYGNISARGSMSAGSLFVDGTVFGISKRTFRLADGTSETITFLGRNP